MHHTLLKAAEPPRAVHARLLNMDPEERQLMVLVDGHPKAVLHPTEASPWMLLELDDDGGVGVSVVDVGGGGSDADVPSLPEKHTFAGLDAARRYTLVLAAAAAAVPDAAHAWSHQVAGHFALSIANLDERPVSVWLGEARLVEALAPNKTSRHQMSALPDRSTTRTLRVMAGDESATRNLLMERDTQTTVFVARGLSGMMLAAVDVTAWEAEQCAGVPMLGCSIAMPRRGKRCFVLQAVNVGDAGGCVTIDNATLRMDPLSLHVPCTVASRDGRGVVRVNGEACTLDAGRANDKWPMMATLLFRNGVLQQKPSVCPLYGATTRLLLASPRLGCTPVCDSSGALRRRHHQLLLPGACRMTLASSCAASHTVHAAARHYALHAQPRSLCTLVSNDDGSIVRGMEMLLQTDGDSDDGEGVGVSASQ